MNLRLTRVRDVKLPVRGTAGSAGIDFFIPNDHGLIVLKQGESILIPSGIRADLPESLALVFMNKSGVAVNKSLTVGAQVVDEDYQGEIHLHVINVGFERQVLKPGEKLVQGLLVHVPKVGIVEVPEDMLFDQVTERAGGGFGSTGTE